MRQILAARFSMQSVPTMQLRTRRYAVRCDNRSFASTARVVGRIVTVAILALATRVAAQPSPQGVPAPPPLDDGSHDFDILHGSWFATHSRLDHPLTGSYWMHHPPGFTGRMVVRALAGGPAAIAEYEMTPRDSTHVRGATIMTYSPGARSWTIRDVNVETGTLGEPLTGHFTHNDRGERVGEFLGVREYNGRSLLVRQTWRMFPPNAAGWVQAFSADGGRTWEENWWSSFARYRDAGPGASPLERDAAADTSVHRESAHTPEEQYRERLSRSIDGAESPATYCCFVLELRQYIVPRGREQTLIDLFERENELARQVRATAGIQREHQILWMENVALFRDLDRPNVYTWLRGYSDPSGENVSAFHYGSIWNSHLDAIERAGITLGEAHVLDPGYLAGGLVLADRPDKPVDSKRSAIIVATVYTIIPNRASAFESWFNQLMLPRIYEAGARPVARFATSVKIPSVPGLDRIFKPKLTPENGVYIWFARFPNVAAYERYRAALERDPVWNNEVLPMVKGHFAAPPQEWKLIPIGRSRPIL